MIKNLLFDLGGVIMDIDRLRCVDAYKALGMKNPEEFLGEYSQTGPFGLLESGQITPAQFHEALRPYLPENVTDSQIDSAFCEFLKGIPEHRLEELKALKKEYKVYILSNTNPIMWYSRIADEFAKLGADISAYCDGVVTSFEEKVMKPDARIFEAACSKLGIKPEDTVFLDDSEANTAAAAALGFHTIHVAPGNEFDALLSARGL